MTEIKYHKDVLLFFDELFDILIEKGYFSYYEYSAQYIDNLIDYVKKNITIKPHKPAPPYFSKYGKNLFFINYNSNKKTTWYIFFEKSDNLFFIRYITNNHFEGHFFV